MKRYLFIDSIVFYFFTFLYLSYSSLSAGDSKRLTGDWFSKIQRTDRGVHTYHIRLDSDGKFSLYRLQLHPIMKWEEARYMGRWEDSPKTDELILFVEKCALYTSRDLQDRRALLRAFDCDHLVMNFHWKTHSSRAILSPNQYGLRHETEFFRPPNHPHRNWAMVFTDGERFLAWGIGLKYYKKGQMGNLWATETHSGRRVEFVEVVETSLEFRIPTQGNEKISPQVGDFLLLP